MCVFIYYNAGNSNIFSVSTTSSRVLSLLASPPPNSNLPSPPLNRCIFLIFAFSDSTECPRQPED